jgi:hypothetical protein
LHALDPTIFAITLCARQALSCFPLSEGQRVWLPGLQIIQVRCALLDPGLCSRVERIRTHKKSAVGSDGEPAAGLNVAHRDDAHVLVA